MDVGKSKINVNAKRTTTGDSFLLAQSPWDQETTLRDQKFKKSRVNSLIYIGKKIGTLDSLRSIKNM